MAATPAPVSCSICSKPVEPGQLICLACGFNLRSATERTRTAEIQPGHPNELVQTFRNWLREAESPIGTLPEGMDAIEWAVRRFIDTWKSPARNAIEKVEESLNQAKALCDSGAPLAEIKSEIDLARQILQVDLRDHLGLYDWNKK